MRHLDADELVVVLLAAVDDAILAVEVFGHVLRQAIAIGTEVAALKVDFQRIVALRALPCVGFEVVE